MEKKVSQPRPKPNIKRKDEKDINLTETGKEFFFF
jgi:hypothetical protein